MEYDDQKFEEINPEFYQNEEKPEDVGPVDEPLDELSQQFVEKLIDKIMDLEENVV